jgi:hypothetical protein
MRQEYLFLLAHLCHVPPNAPIRLGDFFNLITGIDAYLAEQQKGG